MIIEIDPKVDVVFHNLFGSPEHYGLTLSFVNSLLAKVGLPTAVELEISNPFQAAKFVNQKSSTLDILYRDAQKRQIQLEMQMQSHAGLSQRMLHNWSQVYQRQLLKGQAFDQHIPVVSVWILNESLFKDEFWLHYFKCYDCQSQKVLHEDMNVVTIELPVWQKTPEAEQAASLDYLGKWLYFLSRAQGMDQEQLLKTLSGPEFSEAVELMSGFTKTERLRHLYDQRENSERMENTWKRTGYLEGKEAGLMEGKLEDARLMLQDGLSVDLVCKYTGLSQDDLKQAGLLSVT